MLKHDLSDATAAAVLARNVQETDANLHLDTAPAAGVASYENPARFEGLRQALLADFPPQTLHEQIVADSVLADLWSQKRYPAWEAALVSAQIRGQWDQISADKPGATSAYRTWAACSAFDDTQRSTLRRLLDLHHRLHHASRANADRLRKARDARESPKPRKARQDH
ncbi:hypothetical protein [uncultured Paludibaculum sp.]|uniref:hypothetical protein n=1 Tax=uncultured Paludibaculum sp. TaxID=1765020 RepID=UPI002AAB6ED7|nr:hypothetical protein [uncultured Paludibaculum sp.]